ncbi:hypothetical protein J2741_000529 [Methanolinea mesophila]|uniref:hypothetical protein n=1 Tax=Methanolinea mesophila TaxID=547055 RepID=UPI001AE23DE2|nr:hypothetical protein [Methanolinea mesophila]MBP1927982.1 hypothetical protein [Methanolinea mesophila]
MKMRIGIILVCCALFGLLLAAGCTSPTSGPATTVATTVPPTTQTTVMTTVPTTAPTTVPTAVIEIPDYLTTPMPTGQKVEVQVTRNTVSTEPYITVSFRGGAGINFLQWLDIIVARSDGTVVVDRLTRPQVNDKIDILGTRGVDNVKVVAQMSDGKRYLIYDQDLAFRTYS